jgi:hypothetical protein
MNMQVEFWICLVLTLFGYIPGIIYAVYAITKWSHPSFCKYFFNLLMLLWSEYISILFDMYGRCLWKVLCKNNFDDQFDLRGFPFQLIWRELCLSRTFIALVLITCIVYDLGLNEPKLILKLYYWFWQIWIFLRKINFDTWMLV